MSKSQERFPIGESLHLTRAEALLSCASNTGMKGPFFHQSPAFTNHENSKSQKARAKSQKPKAKSQKPELAARS
jgi:hypothetical protein